MLVLLLALAQAAEPDLSGRYEVAEAPDALAGIHDKAVQEALDQLPWAFRAIARYRLEPAVRTCGALEIELSSEVFQSTCDERAPYRHERSSAERSHTGEDGKTYAVRLRVDDQAVHVRFSGDEGGQESSYVHQEDGSLLVTKKIFSGHLPNPISWTVRYLQR